MSKSSERWLSTEAVDIDAYLLEDGSWFLFAMVKDARLAGGSDRWPEILSGFSYGEVKLVGRALKTEQGSQPLSPLSGDGRTEAADAGQELWTQEQSASFRLESANVLNPGLFLDQKLNRRRLRELIVAAHAQGSLLNLFSYTGSFTVIGLKAGLKQSTSVDLSRRYLSWERENAARTLGPALADVKHQLICDDAREFLRRAVKRGLKYRWIVIDPPTFARPAKGKGAGVFRVQTELFALGSEAMQCLEPGGAMLLSTNDSTWQHDDFIEQARELTRSRQGARLERGELPPDFPRSHPLKSVWILTA